MRAAPPSPPRRMTTPTTNPAHPLPATPPPRHRVGTNSGAHLVLRPRRWPRRLLITANVAVALCLIGVASAYGYVNWRFGQIHTKKLPALTAIGGGGGKPFTLLVVGSDSRAALSNTPDNAQFGGSADVGGQRSDTIILVRVVPKHPATDASLHPPRPVGGHSRPGIQSNQHRVRHRPQPADPDHPAGPRRARSTITSRSTSTPSATSATPSAASTSTSPRRPRTTIPCSTSRPPAATT